MKKRTEEILNLLDEQYGREYICYLNYETPWQLLIATMLSAQCTDARVNIVTKDLFQKYTSVDAFADADLKELEQDIKPTGFYRNKAKNIIACMKDIREKFGGEVPRSLEDLTSLAGVGRKTANVIRGNIYHDASVVVDTHVKRISNRLGFTKQSDPEKIEQDLMKELRKYAQEGPQLFPDGMTTDQPERQVMGEILREKLLLCLDKEIPHGTAVEITKFSERDSGVIDVDATIYCEKASHKGIIIGKQGAMLKKISSLARQDMEKFMGTKVYLETWVKVKENWRDSLAGVHNMGYREDS